MVLADGTLDGFAVLAKGKFNRADDGPLHGTYVELYKLLDVAEFSRAEYALSGKVTQLTLRGRRYSAFVNAIRDTSVFVQSEQLAFAKYPVSVAIDGDALGLREPAHV